MKLTKARLQQMIKEVMDDETAKELGLRALAAGFPRRPYPRGHYGVRSSDGALWRATMTATPWPDFRDPATLGVLLDIGHHAIEAEALVAALEAAKEV